MTDSRDEKTVQEIAEKLVRFTEFADGKRYLTIGWPGSGFWSFRQILEDGVQKQVEELVRNSTAAAIREAIKLTRDQQWIAVSERVPEKRQEVICYCKDRTIQGGARHGDGGWFDMAVTHWQPLPSPPALNPDERTTR